jgi:hypothetical protein
MFVLVGLASAAPLQPLAGAEARPVDRCTAALEPPARKREPPIGSAQFEIGPDGPGEAVPSHPAYVHVRAGWARHGGDPAVDVGEGIVRVGDMLQLWTAGTSCAHTSKGCADGHWELPERLSATFPVGPEACFGARVHLAEGSVVLLGEELVALARPLLPPELETASLVERWPHVPPASVAGRWPLPSRIDGWASDDERLVVSTADGSVSMLQWTVASPQLSRIEAVEGPILAVEGDLLVTDTAVLALDEARQVRWRLDVKAWAMLRTAEALWVVSGQDGAYLQQLDPASGAVLRSWGLVDRPLRAARLEELLGEPRLADHPVALRLEWSER